MLSINKVRIRIQLISLSNCHLINKTNISRFNTYNTIFRFIYQLHKYKKIVKSVIPGLSLWSRWISPNTFFFYYLGKCNRIRRVIVCWYIYIYMYYNITRFSFFILSSHSHLLGKWKMWYIRNNADREIRLHRSPAEPKNVFPDMRRRRRSPRQYFIWPLFLPSPIPPLQKPYICAAKPQPSFSSARASCQGVLYALACLCTDGYMLLLITVNILFDNLPRGELVSKPGVVQLVLVWMRQTRGTTTTMPYT